MRTLNRPMFNMGGPIKQGIMHGIREPKRDGGKMLLVGQHPKEFQDNSGREKHVAPLVLAAPAAWTAARMAAMRMAPRAINWAKNIFGKTKPTNVDIGHKIKWRAPVSGHQRGYTGTAKAGGWERGAPITESQQVFTPYKFWANDPLYKAAVGSKGIAGKAIRGGGRLIKGAVTTPTGLIATGITTKMLWPDGTEKTTEELIEDNVIRKGDKDYGPYKKGKPTITQEMRDAKAKADKEKRINALLDTMGYDKARKNAAYDALIDAGRMVSERGTLDTKNIGRELIDPIVASASQRFDKPEQIREAVGLMQVKADIAKEMEDPETKELRRLQIKNQEKALKGKGFSEVITDRITRGDQPTGATLASILRATEGIDAKVIDTTKKPKGKDALDWVTTIVQESHTNPDTPPHPAGTFVVSNRVLIIDEQGNVTPYL